MLLSLLEVFGVLWIVVEAGAFFSEEFSESVRTHWWLFLVVGCLVGLIRAVPRLSVSASVAGTDCDITIRVGDLFDVKDVAHIVPANTTFDTSLEDGTIDETSVQGQFTTRFFMSCEQLDREIMYSLKGVECKSVDAQEKSYGKRQRYEVGTVASIVVEKKRIHLVAIATMNAHKTAQATRRDVQDALPRLWEHIRTRGGIETLCCPILGSGFSRVDASREELVCELVRSFIPAVKAGTFCRGLVIVVSRRDYSDGHLNLERVGRFLEHECTYGSSALGASNLPTAGISQD